MRCRVSIHNDRVGDHQIRGLVCAAEAVEREGGNFESRPGVGQVGWKEGIEGV